jgi:hypothetical protein
MTTGRAPWLPQPRRAGGTQAHVLNQAEARGWCCQAFLACKTRSSSTNLVSCFKQLFKADMSSNPH